MNSTPRDPGAGQQAGGTTLLHFEEALLGELREVVARQEPVRRQVPRGRRRPLLLAAAAAVASGALAAGLVAAIPGRPAPATGGYTLDAFLNGAASAALASRTALPRPDQAFFEMELVDLHTGRPDERVCMVVWTPYPLTGKGGQFGVGGRSDCGPRVPRNLGLLAHPLPGYAYPALDSLPGKPAALRSALYAAATLGPAHWQLFGASYSSDDVVFMLASRLLQVPLPGPLRAAVYEVIASLPGVTLVPNATDALGRHGTGIEMRDQVNDGGGQLTIEFIVAPGTYRYLGLEVRAPGWLHQFAVIRTGLVTRPAA